MRRYDNVVVGSGVSGLTLALLLGLNNRKVLLIEKAPQIGGSLSRFRCNGLPFDTGFHPPYQHTPFSPFEYSIPQTSTIPISVVSRGISSSTASLITCWSGFFPLT